MLWRRRNDIFSPKIQNREIYINNKKNRELKAIHYAQCAE
jgi:hypothetical protein